MESWTRRGEEAEEISDGPCTYEIRVKGIMGETWSNWFEGMQIAHQSDVTILAGDVIDQSALRGILSKIWDLNLTLVSVKRLEKNRSGRHQLSPTAGRGNTIEKGGGK